MDSLTLDQMAVFVAVADTGSFSAAARKLKRAQSAITYSIQNLELQTGANLFDRTTYRPSLTPAGQALLPRARRILDDLTAYRHQARSLLAGIESRLTIAVDVVVPSELLTMALKAFNTEYPMVEMSFLIQPMEPTLASLRNGTADFGMIVDVSMPNLLEGMTRIKCGELKSVLLASPSHPLVQLRKPIRRDDLRNHTQLLLSSNLPSTLKDWGAHAINRWRLNDLGFRRALLLAGIGWCSMPYHLVAEDLRAKRLVALKMDKADAEPLPTFPISVAHLESKVLGPAGRWLADRLAGQ